LRIVDDWCRSTVMSLGVSFGVGVLEGFYETYSLGSSKLRDQ
jgi:hypothetical protein